jgi:RNA polymerase sigma-70 factor, ECF subfamily
MDDATAIRKCQTGEKEAFRFLVERYQAEAVGHAIAILADREDALDVVQEAFLDAFQALGQFDIERRFYPWFYIILRNRCYKLSTARKRRELDSSSDPEILAPAPNVTPEECLLLERAMLELEPKDRELITLKHLDGLSYDELAERLVVPRGTVMSRLFHARKRLRKKLARHAFTGFTEG